MKNSVIALSLVAMFLSVGCSNKEKSEPATTQAVATSPAPAEPVAPTLGLSKDVPAEIKDLASKEDGSCAIDILNKIPVDQNVEVISINRADGLMVDGWALDEKTNVVSPVVVMELAKGEERYYAPLNRHGGRDDLTKGFGKAEYTNAGFSGSNNISSLQAGEYDVRIIQKAGGNKLVCSIKHKLNVKV